jgi:putative FmdB family regulatory protein
MPTYDYDCARCGRFEALRPMSLRDAPLACPACDAPAPRAVGAPRLATMDATRRRAVGVNERAAHEPKSSSSYARLKHPPGCGCCAPGKSRSTVVMPNGNKTFIGQRPWMISH